MLELNCVDKNMNKVKVVKVDSDVLSNVKGILKVFDISDCQVINN